MSTAEQRSGLGWETWLAREVDRHLNTPFAWGRHDCGTFVLAVAGAMLGRPPVWETPWHDETSGRAMMEAFGGMQGALRELARLNGWRAVVRPRTCAQRGDIVLIRDMADTACLGVCIGALVAAPGATGLEFLMPSRVVAAYAIDEKTNPMKKCLR